MKILGLLDNTICILLEGARIIIQPELNGNDLADIKNYQTDLPIFKNWDEVEIAAYGRTRNTTEY
jgi:hypothetical protein